MTESYTSFGTSSTWHTKVHISGNISSSQSFCINDGSLASWFNDTPSVISSGINVRCLIDGYPTSWLVDEDIVLIERFVAVCWCYTVLCCAVIHYAVLHCVALYYAMLSVLCWVLLRGRLRILLACIVAGSFCEAVQLTVGLRKVLYPFSTRDNKCKNAFSVVRRATTLLNYLSINGQK